MVKKEQSKRQKSIRSKLMAAVCMLLVSAIMMVSSTYAWFTLSTAPEVTGINTSVGANGNLEMALLPKDALTSGAIDFGITSQAGDSVRATEAKNVTWGNLVDLSESGVYGLDKITLYPAELNNTGATLVGTFLKTPSYGADGRVSELLANTVTGYFNTTEDSFLPNEEYGVRAVGTASGMTDRQLDYRNARTNANTAMAQAKTAASQSLNSNGSSLANVAIKKGTGAQSFEQKDVDAFKVIVDDLLGTNSKTGALQHIETAYIQYILAYAASNATNTPGSDDSVTVNDTVWLAVRSAVNAAGATLDSVITALGGEDSLPVELKTAVSAYKTSLANVEAARSKLNALQAGENGEYAWENLSPILQLLADPEQMLVNGIIAGQIMQEDNMNKLVNSVAGGAGIVVSIATGGGVYADIADQCGDFTASVSIEKVEFKGLELGPINARMATQTKVATPYLAAISAVVESAGAPISGGNDTMPITDMYGYIIDLAFRTNAAESNLLLQVDAVDRIYSNNTNEETMGHGSSMTFAATTNDFSNDQVKALMSAIRLVFFKPTETSDNIIVYGKLDVNNATVGTDGVTAKITLYEVTDGSTRYVEAIYIVDDAEAGTYKLAGDNETATHALVGDKYELATHIADNTANGGYRAISGSEVATHVEVTTSAGESIKANNVIMPLTQNTATALSVLVYLDGNSVGNDDVAATAATSMTGTMNLQFSSSATLVPMEYASLHTPANSGTGTESGNESGTQP